MNFQIKLVFILAFTVPIIGFTMPINNNAYWICKTHDNNHLEWTVKNLYKKVALNLSFEACKKQSKSPLTCKTSSNDCEGFENGKSTRPLWRCTALERGSGYWRSNYYANREDAAIAAKDYCKSQSNIPETCYVNLITCMNTNKE
jgi:hypothetical protein